MKAIYTTIIFLLLASSCTKPISYQIKVNNKSPFKINLLKATLDRGTKTFMINPNASTEVFTLVQQSTDIDGVNYLDLFVNQYLVQNTVNYYNISTPIKRSELSKTTLNEFNITIDSSILPSINFIIH